MYWTAHQKHVDFEYTYTFVNNFAPLSPHTAHVGSRWDIHSHWCFSGGGLTKCVYLFWLVCLIYAGNFYMLFPYTCPYFTP